MPAQGAATDDGFQFGVHHHVPERGAAARDPGAFEDHGEFVPREVPAAFQAFGDQRVAFGQEPGVEFELAVVGGVQGFDTRRGELQQPANIGGPDEVPGRAKEVSAKYLAVGEGLVHLGAGRALGALGHGPFGVGEFLRLHGRQAFDDLLGAGAEGSPEPVLVHSLARNLRVGHWPVTAFTR